MMTIKAFIARHPVLTYHVLTFAISWGGMLGRMRAPFPPLPSSLLPQL